MLYSLRYINLPEGEIRVRGLYFVYVKNGGLIRWKAIRYMWM